MLGVTQEYLHDKFKFPAKINVQILYAKCTIFCSVLTKAGIFG
jgi:hypothetical protein